MASHDTRALQAWLDHKNIQHTVRYTELAPELLEELTKAKPWKTDLFATAEDDIRQFGAAMFGLFRAAPRAMTKRVGTTTRRDFARCATITIR